MKLIAPVKSNSEVDSKTPVDKVIMIVIIVLTIRVFRKQSHVIPEFIGPTNI
jgi:hypothetical protein